MAIQTSTKLVAVMLGTVLLGGCNGSKLGERRPITVIGHRGEPSRNPENTLASFRGAVEAGADLVELDARASADRTLFCLHDATLDRTTDVEELRGGKKVALSALRDAEIRALDAGGWLAPRFAGERIPTLSDAVAAIQEGSSTLIEHKDGDAPAYVQFLKDRGLVNKVVVQSFNWQFLTAFHALLPEQKIGALGGKELDGAKLETLETTGTKLVVWDYKTLSTANVRMLKDRGYEVWVYTVNEPIDWQHMIEAGVDGIITDKPRELGAWLKQHHYSRPAR